MESPRKKFWTVVINKISIEALPGYGVAQIVEGHFIYITIWAEKTDVKIDTHYLTPPEEPFKFVLPPWFFGDDRVDTISPQLVTSKFVELMANPVDIIPPAPLDVRWDKIPPHKRKKLAAVKRKEQSKRWSAQEPGKGP